MVRVAALEMGETAAVVSPVGVWGVMQHAPRLPCLGEMGVWGVVGGVLAPQAGMAMVMMRVGVGGMVVVGVAWQWMLG